MFKNWRFWLPVVVVGSSGFFGLTYTFLIILKRRRKTESLDLQESQEPEPLEDGTKIKKIIVLGLDGSGKSEFMSSLSHSSNSTTENIEPTEGFNIVCQNSDSLSLNYWEIGGQKKLREYWPNFYSGTHLVVFLIDSSDKARFEEAASEFKILINESKLKNIPFFLLINEKGKNGCASIEEVKTALKIEAIHKNEKTVKVLSCQARNFDSVNQVQDQIKDLLSKD